MLFFSVGINHHQSDDYQYAEALAGTLRIPKAAIKGLDQAFSLEQTKAHESDQIFCLAHSNDREFGGNNVRQFVKKMLAQYPNNPLNLTATELLDKLAQLIPPPRRHRHHYHGVLAPNSKCNQPGVHLMSVVMKMAMFQYTMNMIKQ